MHSSVAFDTHTLLASITTIHFQTSSSQTETASTGQYPGPSTPPSALRVHECHFPRDFLQVESHVFLGQQPILSAAGGKEGTGSPQTNPWGRSNCAGVTAPTSYSLKRQPRGVKAVSSWCCPGVTSAIHGRRGIWVTLELAHPLFGHWPLEGAPSSPQTHHALSEPRR